MKNWNLYVSQVFCEHLEVLSHQKKFQVSSIILSIRPRHLNFDPKSHSFRQGIVLKDGPFLGHFSEMIPCHAGSRLKPTQKQKVTTFFDVKNYFQFKMIRAPFLMLFSQVFSIHSMLDKKWISAFAIFKKVFLSIWAKSCLVLSKNVFVLRTQEFS